MNDVLYWLWLAEAVGSAWGGAGRFLAEWGGPARLYEFLQDGGRMPPCFTPKAAGLLRSRSPLDYAARAARCAAAGAVIVTPDGPDYPDRLRDLPDLPLTLYVTGDAACLNGHGYAAVIGTRRPDAYGTQAAYDLSLEMAKQGAVIVSGLADGLDSVSHRAALDAGTPTVAFMGTPVDVTFPAANAHLRARIEAAGGAVASEYPPDFGRRTRGTFLARNRLIAGLAQVVCVAQAREKSGTLNTVRHAEEYGRPVLAVPGSIYSPLCQGTNALLRDGKAGALCRAADALRFLDLRDRPPAPPAEPQQLSFADDAALGPDARAVRAVLGPKPMGLDAICAAAALPAARVLAACTELELAGAAESLPGRRFTGK